MLKHMKELAMLDGISGCEKDVCAYLIEALKEYPCNVSWTVDPLGNLLCEVKGEAPAKRRVLFNAHMDEVGMIVIGITGDGMLRFANVGGMG